MSSEATQRVARACPGCGSGQRKPLPRYSRGDWSTVACADCGFVYLSEAPVYSALSEDLAWSKQFAKEKKARKERAPVITWLDQKTRWRLHIARDNEWAYIAEKIPSGRVLDVGCGPVNHVPDPFTPFGIEIERAAAEVSDALMRPRGGRVVHAPALDGFAQFEDGFFDGVIMRSYLEHEMNPKDVLAAARAKLRSGGVAYVKVPNFGTINRQVRGVDWCGFRFPDHLNYFDVGGLERMAKATGYRFELRNKLTRLTNDNMHCFLTRI